MRGLIQLTFCIVLFSICTGIASAVEPFTPVRPDPVEEAWRWRGFPELRGLGLRCMDVASDGKVWFGVDDGIRVYDGVNWTAYTEADGLKGGVATALCGARDGSVYAATPAGIYLFSGGEWSKASPGPEDLFGPAFDLLEGADGSVWAGSWWGALRLRPEGPTLFATEEIGRAFKLLVPDLALVSVPESVTSAVSWSESTGLATSAATAGFRESKELRRRVRSVAPGGPGERAGIRPGDRVLNRLDSAGDTSSGILEVFRPGGSGFEVRLDRAEVSGVGRGFSVFDVLEDRQGRIWFGLSEGHIIRYDGRIQVSTSNDAWDRYDESDGLDIGIRPSITQTPDGAIWAVSRAFSPGVNRFSGGTWSSFRLSDQLGWVDVCPSIHVSRDGTLWIGAPGRLYAMRGGEWSIHEIIPATWIYTIGLSEDPEGGLWLAGEGHSAARVELGSQRYETLEGLYHACTTQNGDEWFIDESYQVVRRSSTSDGAGSTGRWTRHTTEDGLMSAVLGMIVTRDGVLWAVGSHEGQAATATFDGSGWHLKPHPGFSTTIMQTAVFESSDGSVWFGAPSTTKAKQHSHGVLQWVPGNRPGEAQGTWRYHTPEEGAPKSCYGVGQSLDGALWFGGVNGVWRLDEGGWQKITEPQELTTSAVNCVHTSSRGDVWFGTRNYGALRCRDGDWVKYDTSNGLPDNEVLQFCSTAGGSVWVSTRGGASRFDGKAWMDAPFLRSSSVDFRPVALHSTPNGLWLSESNSVWSGWYGPDTVRPKGWVDRHLTRAYSPETDPPETELTAYAGTVSQPGNTTVAWLGADPWKATTDTELQYAYRLDDGVWSHYVSDTNIILEALPSGEHTFEVRARDLDLNVDPTPASVTFTVVPPVWQEPWFIALMAVMVGAVGFQTARVIRRDRRLREGNAALSAANKDLFGLNQTLEETNKQLDREGALERIRARALGMQSSADFASAAESVFAETSRLGVDIWRVMVGSIDRQAGQVEYWITTASGSLILEDRGTFGLKTMESNPFTAMVPQAVERGDPHCYYRCTGEEMQAYVRFAIDLLGAPITEWDTMPADALPTSLECYWFFSSYSSSFTYLALREPLSDDHLRAMEGFSDTFGLAHKRLVELRGAEEQARRAELRAAVDRVRAEATAMQKSPDFGNVVRELWEALERCEMTFQSFAFNVLDRGADEMQVYGTLSEHDAVYMEGVSRDKLFLEDVLEGVDLWRTVVPMAFADSHGWAKPGVTPALGNLPPDFPEILRKAWGGGSWPASYAGRSGINVPFAHGGLFVMAPEDHAYGEQDLQTIEQFAGALSLGFSRFFDLQQLEKRAREAEVTAALERVRSAALGMETSGDIGGVAGTVFNELKNLKMPVLRAAVIVYEGDMVLNWATSASGELQPSVRYTLETQNKLQFCKSGYEAWKKGEPLYHYRLAGEELTESARYALDHLKAPYHEWDSGSSDELPKQVDVYFVNYSRGCLYLPFLEPPADVDIQVLQKFAETFGFAYTRFQELQDAEAHAREAERRSAVDRVRAEVATMRTSADLERVTPLIWHELTGLGVPFSRCGVFTIDENTEQVELYLTNPEGESLGIFSLGFDSHSTIKGMVDRWREKQVYVEDWDQQSFVDWMGFLESQGVPVDPVHYQDGEAPPESLVLQAIPFAQGVLYVAGPTALSEADLSVVRDLSEAFSVAYARYMDFQSLEDQNRAMSDANKELYKVNRELQRERAVERIREKVQTMEEASDFEAVLSLLAEDLESTGLAFETCGIEVLDEPVDSPTMPYFEEHGYRYTAYTIDPEGAVSSSSYTIPAPFPPVNLEAIQRFIEGQPWQAFTGGTNSILEVPAAGYGRLRLTALDRKEYSEEEVETLKDFAAAVALGYARFLDLKAVEEARQREMEELEKELQVAHDMQMSLLPDAPPEVEGIELSGICVPANHVGGDYFQYVPMEEGRLGIVVADVSGHAMQAATVAMRFNEMLRYELRGRTSPTEILEGLDQSLKGQIPETMFVTCGIGVWDPSDRSFAFASAANPEVYQFAQADGAIKPFGIQGIPLGLQLPAGVDAPFGSTKVTLAAGDLLVFTSDGVEEALDGSENFYEAERLSALIGKLGQAGASADEMRDGITEDVRGFIGGAAQSDDITVVVVKAT